MELLGIHHVSALTKDIQKCYDFYHHVLGMKLIKETVNQDDIASYHLYFGDKEGTPGTIITFFDFKSLTVQQKGTDSIYAYCLRVPTDRSLYAYKLRFDEYQVKYDAVIQINGRHALPFYDCDDRLVYLISDETNTGIQSGVPDEQSPVESIHQINGVGPVLLMINHTLVTASVLHQIMGLERQEEYSHHDSAEAVQVFSMAAGGNGGEVHLLQQSGVQAKQGAGGSHHIAFRVKNIEQALERLKAAEIKNSGIIDRYYFKSLYFRDLSGVLFELATDLPGFTVDEEVDQLGFSLSLPPSLERQRVEIEDQLKPIKKGAL
ncbi:ring-cleaving dioxygenase [Macrococcus hajekii]|uniref:Ring-cleaving dioxygenase n=1 Tax=Macrococcus hajekii TaxID=198482 RepID=A0A4V3BE80_9STAP|nr:VOC family protein [Macrococcus hajekii]TDM03045.1 ring-cleaving dioxygenase [Macrococcus hajekii]GGB06120.1 glyoxalase [Macrococcus hajekii]